MRLDRTALGALAGVGALLVGGGTALAAKGTGDKASACQARLARIAERRGVTTAQLEADVKTRLLARVDAALAAGRLTTEQAAALRERIASAEPCSGPIRSALRRHARHRLLDLAAAYLGLTPKQLRAQLPGTSLAALAVQNGKTVEGLEAALLAAAKDRLAKAVSTGELTQSQADARFAKLQQRVQRLVAKSFPTRS